LLARRRHAFQATTETFLGEDRQDAQRCPGLDGLERFGRIAGERVDMPSLQGVQGIAAALERDKAHGPVVAPCRTHQQRGLDPILAAHGAPRAKHHAGR